MTDTGINEQVYNLHEDSTLLSSVASVICVLVPRGLLLAGFDEAGEVLALHFSGYGDHRPIWQLDFFEHLFSTEPLLAVKSKVKGVFLSSHKTMVVPQELYTEQEAKAWLNKVFQQEPIERFGMAEVAKDKVVIAHMVPTHISELARINFKNVKELPLMASNFAGKDAQSLQLCCCFTGNDAILTLHNYSQLLWHTVTPYSSAADIAYLVMHHCKLNYIDHNKLSVVCNTMQGTEFEMLNELSRYFPGLRSGEGEPIANRWEPVIALANRLKSCVL